jgi:hypothetical protein
MFTHVCTAPVKYNPWCGVVWCSDWPATYVVTGVQLHVMAHDAIDVLHHRLLYAELPDCAIV